MKEEILHIKDRVLNILQEHPETRNDDRLLIIEYLKDTGHLKTATYGYFLNFNKINTLPNFESIRRIRQKIQNTHGLFPSTPEAKANREIKEIEMREINKWL